MMVFPRKSLLANCFLVAAPSQSLAHLLRIRERIRVYLHYFLVNLQHRIYPCFVQKKNEFTLAIP